MFRKDDLVQVLPGEAMAGAVGVVVGQVPSGFAVRFTLGEVVVCDAGQIAYLPSWEATVPGWHLARVEALAA